jgi:hypothetical protein
MRCSNLLGPRIQQACVSQISNDFQKCYGRNLERTQEAIRGAMLAQRNARS